MGKRARRRKRDEPQDGYKTVDELRGQGIAIDVPFESASGATLHYADGESFRDKYPEMFEPEGDPPPT